MVEDVIYKQTNDDQYLHELKTKVTFYLDKTWFNTLLYVALTLMQLIGSFNNGLISKANSSVFWIEPSPLQIHSIWFNWNCFQHGKRDRATVMFNSSLDSIFVVKKYADALTEVIKERNIQANFSHQLIEVKPDTKEAVFRLLDQPEGTTKTFKVLIWFHLWLFGIDLYTFVCSVWNAACCSSNECSTFSRNQQRVGQRSRISRIR